MSSYDEVVRDVIYLRSGASFEREAEAPAALHLVVPPELDKRCYWEGTGFTGVYWLQPGQPVYGHPSYRHSWEAERDGSSRTRPSLGSKTRVLAGPCWPGPYETDRAPWITVRLTGAQAVGLGRATRVPQWTAGYRFVYGFEAVYAAKTIAVTGPWHHGLRCEALTEEEAHTLLAERQRATQDAGSESLLR